MPTTRLYQQFQRLAQQLGCDEREISLAEVADLLCCTRAMPACLLRRHGRAGLAVLDGGRQGGAALPPHPARQPGEPDPAPIAGSAESGPAGAGGAAGRRSLDLLTPLLIEQLGQATREGRQILRVPYYRPPPSLLPTAPLRCPEIHLSRQIFNGLTRRNEENGEIEGIWPTTGSVGPCHWRFYLRPAVRFHHGRELVVEDVMESLLALRDRPLFAHLARLESPWPRTLDLYLDSPDPCCPTCWPSRWRPFCRASSRGGGLCPATGGHRPLSGDRQRPAAAVPRAAFDDYFGLRALLDEIDIWMLPELAERLESHLQAGRDSPELGTMRGESELESGCYFLLQDERSRARRILPCASGSFSCSTPWP